MKSLAEQATDRINDLIKLINTFRDEVSEAKRKTTDPEVQQMLTYQQARMLTINTDLHGLKATVAAARMTHGLDGNRAPERTMHEIEEEEGVLAL